MVFQNVKLLELQKFWWTNLWPSSTDSTNRHSTLLSTLLEVAVVSLFLLNVACVIFSANLCTYEPVYEASRRILHFEGTFVTTVGDELTVANAELQWKTGIRSLKRTFFKKDKKAVRYWAVHLDRREHVRETLDTLRAAVVHSGVRVPVSEIFPFEQASKAFGTNQMGSGTTVKVLGI